MPPFRVKMVKKHCVKAVIRDCASHTQYKKLLIVFLLLFLVQVLQTTIIMIEPASWSSGNAFVSGAVGLRFESRAGQVGRSVVNGSPLLLHFFKEAALPGRNDAKMGPKNLLHPFA